MQEGHDPGAVADGVGAEVGVVHSVGNALLHRPPYSPKTWKIANFIVAFAPPLRNGNR